MADPRKSIGGAATAIVPTARPITVTGMDGGIMGGTTSMAVSLAETVEMVVLIDIGDQDKR